VFSSRAAQRAWRLIAFDPFQDLSRDSKETAVANHMFCFVVRAGSLLFVEA
jgi:hypothetical protein